MTRFTISRESPHAHVDKERRQNVFFVCDFASLIPPLNLLFFFRTRTTTNAVYAICHFGSFWEWDFPLLRERIIGQKGEKNWLAR